MKRVYLFLPALLLGLTFGASFSADVRAGKDPLVDKMITAEGELFFATLKGSDEVPAVNTGAMGEVTFFFDEGANVMRYVLRTEGMTATAAHIHKGAMGENGDVVVHLNVSPTGVSEGTITDADLTGPMADMTLMQLADEMEHSTVYVNVHSAEHPQGEIRGQLKFTGGAEPMGAVED